MKLLVGCITIAATFFDPNGIRVELTTPTVPKAQMDAHALHARADLDAWTLRKAELRRAAVKAPA